MTEAMSRLPSTGLGHESATNSAESLVQLGKVYFVFGNERERWVRFLA